MPDDFDRGEEVLEVRLHRLIVTRRPRVIGVPAREIQEIEVHFRHVGACVLTGSVDHADGSTDADP